MKILITVILILVLASPAAGFERSLDLQADGRINLHSITFNDHIKTGVTITGDGAINLEAASMLDEVNHDQAYEIQMQAASGMRPVKAVTAIMAPGANYAIMAAPDPGEQALLEIWYQYYKADHEGDPGDLIMVFSELEINARAQVTMGEFRSYIDIKDQDGAGIKEEIRVRSGTTIYDDFISVDKLDKIEVEIGGE